jgi:hypothetical protein
MNYKPRIQTDHKIHETFHYGVNLRSPMRTKIIVANIKKKSSKIINELQFSVDFMFSVCMCARFQASLRGSFEGNKDNIEVLKAYTRC